MTTSNKKGGLVKPAKMREDIMERLRWLEERGCPVDCSDQPTTIRIEQTQGDDRTLLFDLPDTRAGYILDLKITNVAAGPCCIRDIDFKMPWSDPRLEWLEDPQETGGLYKKLYQFPGGSYDFSRDQVVNHILLGHGILRPHNPLRGLLLAIGTPMSPEISHGSRFTGVLTLDIEGRASTSCDIELWADRLTEPRHKILARPVSSESLFGKRLGKNGAPADNSGYQNEARRIPPSLHPAVNRGKFNGRPQ